MFQKAGRTLKFKSKEPWNTETHKKDRNPLITNHKPWPFETVEVNFCFLRGRLRRHRTFRVWLTSQRNSKSKTSVKFREKRDRCLAFTSSTKRAISRSSRAATAKKCTKKRDAREKWCFANLTLLLFCRPRCRRREDPGRKKTGGDGKRKERKRGLFLIPIVPRALAIFSDYCSFYWDSQRQSLRRRREI